MVVWMKGIRGKEINTILYSTFFPSLLSPAFLAAAGSVAVVWFLFRFIVVFRESNSASGFVWTRRPEVAPSWGDLQKNAWHIL